MGKRAFILMLFVVGISSSLWTQEDAYTKNKTYTHQLSSEAGRAYLIKVTPPLSYSENKEYSVLIYLDAWWLEDVVKGNYTLLQRAKEVEDVILVGISVAGDNREFLSQRTLDYTPTPFDLSIMGFPLFIPQKTGKSFRIHKGNSGQSEAFTDFLQEKLLPMLGKKYQVDHSDLGLLGHSLGGLYGIYTLSAKPQLFNRFIILAPALWWNKSKSYYQNISDHLSASDKQIDLFMCYGEKEGYPIALWTSRLDEFIKSQSYPGLNYAFKKYPGANHTSILPQSIYDGLKFMYGK